MINENYHFENYLRGFISADLINDPIRDLFREYQHIQKDSFTEPPERCSDEAERRLENIFYYSDKLTPEERKTVLESILQNDRNIYFDVYLFNNQEKDLKPEIWRNIKRLVNREIEKYLDSPGTPDSRSPEPVKTAPKDKKPTMFQVGLYYFYTGKYMSDSDRKEITKKYGWNSDTSIRDLRTAYNRAQNDNERLNVTGKKREYESFNERIRYIEAVKKWILSEYSVNDPELSDIIEKIDSDLQVLENKRDSL